MCYDCRECIACHFFEENGIDVVLELENTYDFCFDGIPKCSTVAVSTNGGIRDKSDRYYFKRELHDLAGVIQKYLILLKIGLVNNEEKII